MNQQNPTSDINEPKAVPLDQTQDDGNKDTDISSIQPVIVIRNRFISNALLVIPWLTILIIVSGVIFNIYYPIESKVMFNIGLLAATLALFVFQGLIRRVSLASTSIWESNIIIGLNEPTQYDPKASEPTSESLSKQSISSILPSTYQNFLHKFEDLMNHLVQWVFSRVSTLFPLIWIPNIFQYVAFYVSRFWIQPGIAILGLLEVLVEFLLAFMIGLLIWRMIVIGLYIWRLGNVFVLKPRMGYPDNCGGLEPIGNLCLWNILLISIAGVFLGGWIILSYFTKVGGNNPLDQFYLIAFRYRHLFIKLLLIPFALSVISFFWPLWSIHEAILAGNSENKQDLDKLAKEIADLDQELIEKSDELDREQEENINKKLAIMRETYERNQRLPKWPLNLKILIEFTSSQIVPLLVALGLSSKIASALQTILGFIK